MKTKICSYRPYGCAEGKNIQKYRTVRSLKGGKLTQNVVGDANDQAAKKNASELREELRTRHSSKWGKGAETI